MENLTSLVNKLQRASPSVTTGNKREFSYRSLPQHQLRKQAARQESTYRCASPMCLFLSCSRSSCMVCRSLKKSNVSSSCSISVTNPAITPCAPAPGNVLVAGVHKTEAPLHHQLPAALGIDLEGPGLSYGRCARHYRQRRRSPRSWSSCTHTTGASGDPWWRT